MRATRAVSRREVGFRKALWHLGVRGYRVGAPLPGRPDLYFPGIGLAVFVHGCFWHRCPSCAFELPIANREFWREKFLGNLRRDRAAEEDLRSHGIDVEVVWEHSLRDDLDGATQHIAGLVALRRGRTRHKRSPEEAGR